MSIYSESETSPTRLKGYRGRHLRSTDGAESDFEKSASQMRHPRSNLKNSSSESSRDRTLVFPFFFFLPVSWRLIRHLTIQFYPPRFLSFPAYPLSSTATHPITLHWSLIRYNPHMSRQCIRFDICLPPRDNIRDFYTGKFWAESDSMKLASKPALDEVRYRFPPLSLSIAFVRQLTPIDRC